MGNTESDVATRLEAKVGKIPLSGRYHRAPRTLQDDYKVGTEELGKGYNGVVKMAYSRHIPDEKYAVKSFRLANVPPDKKQQLEAEVEIFLTLDHPHVCRLIDVYESSDYLFLIMECMHGGELFDRIIELKTFAERDAANAIQQMLLALNYLHSHGIVHRDIKLENFLYDKPGSHHLKLIDFGFSKVWDPSIKMKMSCGTLSYVAPEVLRKSYTSQCDLWSLGVIVFILVSGSMPFFESKSGSGNDMITNIKRGLYTMKPEKWSRLSQECVDFTKALLQVDPEKRLTAEQALNDPWITKRQEISTEIDTSVVNALRQFSQASKFRRCCMEMMAWSLTNEDRAKVREYFLAMDKTQQGTITLQELKQVLEEQFKFSGSETQAIFNSLDTNNDQEIHYSDFLAAMVSQRIALHDDLLKATFMKFDTDNSGYITKENLVQVLGESHDGVDVENLLAEADLEHNGRISYREFVCYLRGEELKDGPANAIMKVIDREKAGDQLPDPLQQFAEKGGTASQAIGSRSTRETEACSPGTCNIH